GEDAAGAEGPGAELQAAAEPADDPAVGEEVGDVVAQRRLVGDGGPVRAGAGQEGIDLGAAVAGAEPRAVLAVTGGGNALVAQQVVPDEQRHAEGPAGVTGGGLDPDGLEWALPRVPAVPTPVRASPPARARLGGGGRGGALFGPGGSPAPGTARAAGAGAR